MCIRDRDVTPVLVEGYKVPIKSIGNSTTTPRDLVSELDVKIILMALSESVGAVSYTHLKVGTSFFLES